MSKVVYVVEEGLYEDRHVQGVYESLEIAKAACPVSKDGWEQVTDRLWANGLDWEDHRYIEVYEIIVR